MGCCGASNDKPVRPPQNTAPKVKVADKSGKAAQAPVEEKVEEAPPVIETKPKSKEEVLFEVIDRIWG